MDLKHSIAFVIGVVFLSIGVADAIECYDCTSLLNNNCGDPFNPDGMNKCTWNSCTKLWISASGTTIVTRGCSPSTLPKDECTDISPDEGKAKICVCGSNLCNGGGFDEPTLTSKPNPTFNGGGMLLPTYAVLLGLPTAILRAIYVI